MRKTAAANICSCGSGHAFDLCCNRFLSGQETPETSLELMRARYAAYTLGDDRYLRRTWYPSTRPQGSITGEIPIQWIRLQIIRHEESATDGLVEFIAYCKVNGRAQKMHETSRFLKDGGQWYYLDGTFTP